jgi:hypothetical protein
MPLEATPEIAELLRSVKGFPLRTENRQLATIKHGFSQLIIAIF